jgi:hypothetical protein
MHTAHLIGTGDNGRVFVEIQYGADGRLSITGVEGPMSNGDARGSCGQIREEVGNVRVFEAGWTPAMVARLVEVWDRWHLNDMQAASPRQRAWLELYPVHATYPESHYELTCAALAEAGLNPDEDHTPTIPNVDTTDGYRYGSAWLREDVPADVIEFLESLPTSDSLPTEWWSR